MPWPGLSRFSGLPFAPFTWSLLVAGFVGFPVSGFAQHGQRSSSVVCLVCLVGGNREFSGFRIFPTWHEVAGPSFRILPPRGSPSADLESLKFLR